MSDKNKYIVSFDIAKEGLDLILKIKANPEVEKLFGNLTNGTVVSQRWKDANGEGLEFYKKNADVEKMENLINRSVALCFDDFGAGLLVNGKVNIALFRIKGISEGIEFRVSELISFEELKKCVADLGKVIKWIYSNYITKSQITAKITYEI